MSSHCHCPLLDPALTISIAEICFCLGAAALDQLKVRACVLALMALALDGPRSKELQQKAKAVYDAVVTYGKVIKLHMGCKDCCVPS